MHLLVLFQVRWRNSWRLLFKVSEHCKKTLLFIILSKQLLKPNQFCILILFYCRDGCGLALKQYELTCSDLVTGENEANAYLYHATLTRTSCVKCFSISCSLHTSTSSIKCSLIACFLDTSRCIKCLFFIMSLDTAILPASSDPL